MEYLRSTPVVAAPNPVETAPAAAPVPPVVTATPRPAVAAHLALGDKGLVDIAAAAAAARLQGGVGLGWGMLLADQCGRQGRIRTMMLA